MIFFLKMTFNKFGMYLPILRYKLPIFCNYLIKLKFGFYKFIVYGSENLATIYQILVKYLKFGIALPNFRKLFYQLPKFGKNHLFHATADFFKTNLTIHEEVERNCIKLCVFVIYFVNYLENGIIKSKSNCQI